VLKSPLPSIHVLAEIHEFVQFSELEGLVAANTISNPGSSEMWRHSPSCLQRVSFSFSFFFFSCSLELVRLVF
jgi:hypothetical protein